MKSKRSPILFVLFLLLTACGSETPSTSSPDDSENFNGEVNTNGTPVTLNYLFQTQLDSEDDTLDLAIPYPAYYSVPFYIKEDGTVTLLAREFPRMVLRACETAVSGCNVIFEGIGDTSLDLVLDACGSDLTDDECGAQDDTAFTGLLTPDGLLTLNAISIRVRVFAVIEGSDGYTADDSDTGLMPNLPRLIVQATTSTVNTGTLTDTGSRVNISAVKLVAGGLIPESMPTLGGAHYISSLTGVFSVDPLSLLE